MLSSSLLSDLPPLPAWLVSILVLVVTVLIRITMRYASRMSVLRKAPLAIDGWPILGSLGFFRARADFLKGGKAQSPNGMFSFYYGPHPVISLSGADARVSYFGARGLDAMAGYAALFAGTPSLGHAEGTEIDARAMQRFKSVMTTSRLVQNLKYLTNDTYSAFKELDISKPMDPFHVIFRLVYQLTHRGLGSHDVANNPKLLRETLAIYTSMNGSSASQVMFPSLPTPGKLMKLWAGAKLHFAFQKIIKDRKTSGRKETDAMQHMIDEGDSDLQISTFIIHSLFAGLVNSSINASWVLCYLARDRYWYNKTQAQVDAVIAKHRQSEDETAVDILHNLTLEDWNTAFPLIHLGLQESIRLNLPGVFMRKNTSGSDIPIPGTNTVIPRHVYAVYLTDDVHMDPDLYPNPLEWNPARYIPGHDDGRKSPLKYLGWGAGLNPCLGKTFAKLKVTITTAMLMALYDFDICDSQGHLSQEPLPMTNRNWLGAEPLIGQVYLKLTQR